MSRIIAVILWVLILILVIGQIKVWLKKAVQRVQKDAEDETTKPQPLNRWQKFQLFLCQALMALSGLALLFFIYSYFSGGAWANARNGAIYAVLVFALSYWWRAGLTK